MKYKPFSYIQLFLLCILLIKSFYLFIHSSLSKKWVGVVKSSEHTHETGELAIISLHQSLGKKKMTIIAHYGA